MTSEWVGRSHVAIVAGKGGVGSSTVAAAMALSAARRGGDVLLLVVDGRPGLGPLVGGPPLTDNEVQLRRFHVNEGGGRVRGRTVPASGAFSDYLELKGVNSLIRRAASAASLDVIAAATPGLEHLLVLGKIKELERERVADLIVVDAPPAGTAAPFLRSPASLLDVVTDGPVREQAHEVTEMLADPVRSQAVLVTLPEETPVNETVELAFDVEDRIGVHLGPVVINACWPDRPGLDVDVSAAVAEQGTRLPAGVRAALERSVAFGRSRQRQQREQIARLAERLPLPRLLLPRLPVAMLGPAELEVLTAALDAAEVSA